MVLRYMHWSFSFDPKCISYLNCELVYTYIAQVTSRCTYDTLLIYVYDKASGARNLNPKPEKVVRHVPYIYVYCWVKQLTHPCTTETDIYDKPRNLLHGRAAGPTACAWTPRSTLSASPTSTAALCTPSRTSAVGARWAVNGTYLYSYTYVYTYRHTYRQISIYIDIDIYK